MHVDDISEVWSDSDQSNVDESINGFIDDSEIDSSPPQLEPNDIPNNASYFALVKCLISFLLLIQARFYLTDKLLEKMLTFLKFSLL